MLSFRPELLDEWKAQPKLAMDMLKQLSTEPMVVLQLIQTMNGVRVKVDHFHCGIAIAGCQAQWQTAMYVLSCMRSWSVRLASSSFNACAVAIRKSRHWNSAVSTWLTAALRRAGLESDVLGYNIALSSSAWVKGLGLLGAMRIQQVQLDEFGSSSLMAAMSGSWQVALQLRALVTQIRPSLVMQNAALQASATWRRALKLLQYMALGSQLRLSCTSFGSVLSTCSSGAWQAASHVLHEMAQKAIEPNQICLTSACNAFKDPARWQSAMKIFHCLEDPRWASSHALCERWQVALEVARSESMFVSLTASLSRARLWRMALLPFGQPSNGRISAYQSAHMWLEALEVLNSCFRTNTQVDITGFNRMLDAEGWQRGLVLLEWLGKLQLEADQISWNILLNSSKNSWRTTAKLLRQMPVASLRADLISVSSCLQSFRWELAFELVKLPLDVLSCNLLLGSVNALGNQTWPLALHIFRTMVMWQVQADQVSYVSSLSACSASGHWERAIVLLWEMNLQRLSSHVASSAVIGACGKVGQWEFALHLLTTLERAKAADVVSYGECIEACANAERLRSAAGPEKSGRSTTT